MRVGSLFSGIGGIDLGLERAGMEIAWQVEIDEWCRKVLTKHWPDVPKYGDIRGLTDLPAVDVLAGGFPCQPISHAGKRKAQDDARWLWPEYARLVRLLRPRYVFVENVPGLLDGPMADVLGDLAACGYDAEWDCIPAAAVGAPHLRDRVWLLAYPGHDGRSAEREQQQAQRPKVFDPGGAGDVADATGDGRYARRAGDAAKVARGREPHRGGSDALLADAHEQGLEGRIEHRQRAGQCAVRSSVEPVAGHWLTEPSVGRVAHGIPKRVDRLRGLGNAVVPQIVTWIGERIMAVDAQREEHMNTRSAT